MSEKHSEEWLKKRRTRWQRNFVQPESFVEKGLVERQKAYIEELFEYLKSKDLGVTGITIIGSTFRGYAKTMRKNDIDIIVFHEGGKFVASYAEIAKHIDEFEQYKLSKEEETFLIHFVNETSEKDIKSAVEEIKSGNEFQSGNDISVAMHLFMPSMSDKIDSDDAIDRVMNKYRGQIADALDSVGESVKSRWMRRFLDRADEDLIYSSVDDMIARGMITEGEKDDYINATKKLIRKRANLLFDRKYQDRLGQRIEEQRNRWEEEG